MGGHSRHGERCDSAPGPEEWSRRNPEGIYKADGDACRGELLVIPYTLHGGHGTTAQLYAVVHVSQPWFVGYARAQITAPLHYRRGMLAFTADCTFDEQMPEYGVLKMAEQHPLVMVDAEGEPYTRCELKPAVEPHATSTILSTAVLFMILPVENSRKCSSIRSFLWSARRMHRNSFIKRFVCPCRSSNVV